MKVLTGHELARLLLAAPDHQVMITLACSHDAVNSLELCGDPSVDIDVSDVFAENGTPLINIKAYVFGVKFGYIDD